jgi:hypothetical protein
MFAPLDVFRMQDGVYIWKAAAENFEMAKSKVEELGPGDYMIFCHTTRKKIIVKLERPA